MPERSDASDGTFGTTNRLITDNGLANTLECQTAAHSVNSSGQVAHQPMKKVHASFIISG